jgi:hypothetical protein
MTGYEPASLLLSTVEWGTACEQPAAALGLDDDLPVLCEPRPIADSGCPPTTFTPVANTL